MRRKSLEKVTNQNPKSLINFDIAHKQAVEELIIEMIDVDLAEAKKEAFLQKEGF